MIKDHKVARSDYQFFRNKYWRDLKQGKQHQRFGQAFMNKFGYKENHDFFDTLWNTNSADEANNIIETHLIDWEK